MVGLAGDLQRSGRFLRVVRPAAPLRAKAARPCMCVVLGRGHGAKSEQPMDKQDQQRPSVEWRSFGRLEGGYRRCMYSFFARVLLADPQAGRRRR